MRDKDLYLQKLRAQLDQWQEKAEKLKAKVSQASADAQWEMNNQSEEILCKIEEGEVKLSELAAAGDDAWESIKEGIESAWDSLKSPFNDAVSKFKR